MSLLTQISKIFSKKQSEQVVGVSLQHDSITLCSLPANDASDTSDSNDNETANFQQLSVQQLDYASAITELQPDWEMIGECHIALNAQQSQIVQVDKPAVPAAEINGALKWQIKDLVTISPDNMVLDYFDGPILAGGKEKINVVCSPIDELKKIIDAVNQKNLDVASITIPEFAFANLLPVQNDACLLVCQQPHEEIVLLIIKKGKLYFHRRLRGFSQIASKTEEELAMLAIDSLALEIQRSSDYFERQLKQAPIKDIKILLPMKTESFFARKLAENSHLPVSILALSTADQDKREYACAIGATMSQARAVEIAQELGNVG